MSIIRKLMGSPTAILILLVAIVGSGCGTSAYEDKMEKTRRDLTEEKQPSQEADNPEPDEAAQ